MALDHDVILVENFRKSLDLYQRSLVWAMTAAAAFFVLTLSLGDPKLPSVSVVYGELSGPAAWFVALGLFFVLGILAASALRSAEAALASLDVESDVLAAVLLYPSLATNSNGFVRVGTVLFSPVAVLIAFGLELQRESGGATERDVSWWLGLMLFVVLIAAPYLGIASRVRHQLGSRSSKPLIQPTVASVYDFPPFDTGLYEGAAFSMTNGNAELVVSVAEHDDIVLSFKRIRWHEFTALYTCTSEQVKSAYLKLVELKGSELAAKYVAEDTAGARAHKDLHHFRVFLHEHGCHELFAESADGSQRPKSVRSADP